MPDLSKTSGASGGRGISASNQAQTLSCKNSCKLTRLLFLLLTICLFSVSALGQPWDGNGVEGDPYQIWTAEDMQAIGADANYWDAHFELMADIDLGVYTGTSFNIIGNSTTEFTGVFDGNDRTVLNFTYDSNGETAVGLFGVIDSVNAVILDVCLDNPSIVIDSGSFPQGGVLAGSLNTGLIQGCRITGGNVTGFTNLGGLVGWTAGGLVKDCNVACTVRGTTQVGGIVGRNNGRITDCHFDGDISGRIDIGGIVGQNSYYIARCSSTGTVTIVYDPGSRYHAGGIAGRNVDTVCYCNSSATITGGEWMGGLVGYNYFATIYECFATGNVSGSNLLGGLVGENHCGTVVNCYAQGDVSGNAAIGGLIGNNENYNSSQYVKYSYSVGYVSGSANVGGLIGYDYSSWGNFEKCFWNHTVNPSLGGIGNSMDPNVIGETTANMKLRATYESAGWNFVSPIWIIEDGVGYPELWWEILTGGYGGGTGAPWDPYLIYTPEQLNTIGRDYSNLNKHFKLMADINLSQYTGEQFNMIGDQINPFTGVFDGNGHSITNFRYTTPQLSKVGLFGYVSGQQSEIKNLTLIEPEVRLTIIDPFSGWGFGAIAGSFYDGRMENCHVIGGTVHGAGNVGGLIGSSMADMYDCSSSCTVSGDNWRVGGLVGSSSAVIISRCHATGTVTGERRVGGLLGESSAELVSECWADCNVSALLNAGAFIGWNTGTVLNCFAQGQASATSSYVGGFTSQNTGSIKNCYSNATATGGDYTGGFCGRNDVRNGGEIENCYSTGTVTATGSPAGGFVGSGSSYYCFWDVNTSGIGVSGDDNYGATGKTTEQMQSLRTFLPWSCEPVWTIDEGVDYPHLIWEDNPGVIISKPTYGGGTGEPNDPYLIYTAEQLNTIGLVLCDSDKHFHLMADIDLSAYTGTSFNIIRGFTGVFDGNGHTISNFQYMYTGSSYISSVGIFTNVYDVNTEIKNLGVIDPNIEVYGPYVGGLVGTMSEGKIIGCYVEGGRVAGQTEVGGLVGTLARYMLGGRVEKSYANTSVFGRSHVGGLVGSHTKGTISDCWSEGKVTGQNNVGGLGGYVSGNISECSAQGTVEGIDKVGGLAGYLSGTCSDSWADCNVYSTGDIVGGFAGESRATISNCRSRGTVSGADKVGGLLGEHIGGSISGCHSDTSVTGSENVGGLIGNNQGSIIVSWAEADVDGHKYVGGLVGRNSSQISECYADSNVQGYSYVGGFVGGNLTTSYALVTNCYSDSNVTGTELVGGFVGYNDNPILYCYSVGQVNAPNDVGGFAGDNPGSILACYWDTQTSGLENSSGGIGKTTSQMKQAATYLDWGSQGVWTIDEGIDYPRLLWEQMPGAEIVDQEYFTGQGTEQSPYLIANVEQFNTIGLVPSTWDKHFELIADVDFSDITGSLYNVIGKVRFPFTGAFNGMGNTISNFSYEHPSEKYVGIFGYVHDPNALIKDITMVHVDINVPAGYNIGSLTGFLAGGTISNCHVKNAHVLGGSVTGGLGGSVVGGLAGSINGTVSDCTCEATVSGFQSIGGFTGSVGPSGHIIRCSADVNVGAYFPGGGFAGTCSGDIEESSVFGKAQGYIWIGGFVGRVYGGGTILNCYANTSTRGQERIGGFVGYLYHNNYILNCYSVGSVDGNDAVGGFVGYGYTGDYTSCFWDSDVNPDMNGIGNTSDPDVTGESTANMQMESTFTDAGWDFVWEVVNGANDIWTIWEGVDYPRLVWENSLSGDFGLDEFWMYQSLPGQSNSDLTAGVSVAEDPMGNSSYTYEWEFILPDDVSIAPTTVAGGGSGDAFWTFAARGCDEPAGLSDSGQVFKVKVTVTGDDFGNTGTAEAEFGIALLGDVNNDGVVELMDRVIVNGFWQTGSAGPFSLRECDLNCDGEVELMDRIIVNAVWRGVLGQDSVSAACPLR